MNIIEEVKNLNIPKDGFVIVGSSILAMKGIRKAEDIDDIDLIVTDKVFDALKEQGWESIVNHFDNREYENLVQGIFEAGREYWDNTNISFFITNPDCVEEFGGIKFQSLKEFYKRKKAWGRPKDIEDVALIDSYFATHI